jgi:hypothetical protein
LVTVRFLLSSIGTPPPSLHPNPTHPPNPPPPPPLLTPPTPRRTKQTWLSARTSA